MRETACVKPIKRWVQSLTLGLLFFHSSPAPSQEAPPVRNRPQTTSERLRELEQRVAELEADAGQQKKIRDEVEKNFSKGIVTLGGFHFRLGGQLKINYEDPQHENDPLLGSTDSPDPHLDLQRFRLVPRVDFPRSKSLGDIFMRGQIDFHPTKGDTILKEATLDHVVQPAWWLESHLKVGLDDRFIRPNRLTENYPLIGNAFWRRESVAIFWEGLIGNRRGKPKKGGGKAATQAGGMAGETGRADDEETPQADSLTEGAGEPVPAKSTRVRSTSHAPFDFVNNWGEVRLDFSIGNGLALDNNEIGKDAGPPFNMLIDDRNFLPPLAMREIGLGAGYGRDFRELGEIDVLGFYYNDELNDASMTFLQTQLTERDLAGVPLRGYGDSTLRGIERHGLNAGYHYESYHLYHALGIVEAMNPRRGDGLDLFYEWIGARDGNLDRTGWYAQASYRISNPRNWRYLRSIEPVVRYGELRLEQAQIPALPLTWNRRQWLVGVILGVVRGVFVRAEYTWNRESTGDGGAANNELLIQLLAQF